ncbi:hypothetical protein [Parapedobacter sp. DT-150]|uniref:hypothetical protein n=1 Tax=Parapedobacter sp. DT-150 TaxID=3396162 RepID=UPI003F1BCBEB
MQRTIEYEHKQDLIIPKQLINPSPLIAKAQKSLMSKLKKHHDNGLLYSGGDCLDINVSPEQVDRTLILMDTFIKTMNKRGHRFLVENWKSYVVISGEKLEMKLKESTKRSEEMNSLGMYDFLRPEV